MRKAMLAAVMAASVGMLVTACQSDNQSYGSSGASGPTRAESEQQILLERSRLAVEELRGNGTLGGTVNDTLSRARGVLVFPNLIKAGFFIGGGGGRGVLMVRQGQGWSAPVFVFAADASFGLQIGAEGGKVVFAIMNDGAVQKLLNGNVDLGGDVSVAVGPIGAGAQGAVTPNVGADLLAFSLQQGLFGGIAIKGGTVTPDKEWNQAFYGPDASPDRIIRAGYARPETRPLKAALAMSPPRRTSSAR